MKTDIIFLTECGGYLNLSRMCGAFEKVIAQRENCDIVDLIRVSLYLESIYTYTPGRGYFMEDNDTLLWDFSHMSLEEMDYFIDAKLLDKVSINGLHREERIKLYHCLWRN